MEPEEEPKAPRTKKVPPVTAPSEKTFGAVVAQPPTKQDEQIAELQEKLTQERDGRREDRFVGLVMLAILLDVVFFSVVSWGGGLAIVVLELIILIPLAKRMGMEELGQIISSVLNRLAGKASERNE
jgi:hypothetical protein